MVKTLTSKRLSFRSHKKNFNQTEMEIIWYYWR